MDYSWATRVNIAVVVPVNKQDWLDCSLGTLVCRLVKSVNIYCCLVSTVVTLVSNLVMWVNNLETKGNIYCLQPVYVEEKMANNSVTWVNKTAKSENIAGFLPQMMAMLANRMVK